MTQGPAPAQASSTIAVPWRWCLEGRGPAGNRPPVSWCRARTTRRCRNLKWSHPTPRPWPSRCAGLRARHSRPVSQFHSSCVFRPTAFAPRGQNDTRRTPPNRFSWVLDRFPEHHLPRPWLIGHRAPWGSCPAHGSVARAAPGTTTTCSDFRSRLLGSSPAVRWLFCSLSSHARQCASLEESNARPVCTRKSSRHPVWRECSGSAPVDKLAKQGRYARSDASFSRGSTGRSSCAHHRSAFAEYPERRQTRGLDHGASRR